VVLPPNPRILRQNTRQYYGVCVFASLWCHEMKPPASVFGPHISRILSGDRVGPTLRDALGDRLASRVLHVVSRVCRIEGEGAGVQTKKGVKRKHQRSAKVRFAPGPVRTVDSRAVRRIVALVLMVLEQMSYDRKRVISRRLWIGCGEKRQSVSLAGRLGVSPREVERYIVILRQGGILEQWQIPASELQDRAPQLVSRRTGYVYACWELVGEMPRELIERFRRWYRKVQPPPQVVPVERLTRPPSRSSDAFAAMAAAAMAAADT